MATRIYLPSTGSPAVTPSDWEHTNQAGTTYTLPGVLSKVSSAFSAIRTATGTTNPYVRGVFRFIIGRLSGGSISGTVRNVMRCYESNAGANATTSIAVKIIQPNGTDRAILLAPTYADSATSPYEYTTTLGSRHAYNTSESEPISLTSQTATAGDYLVIEIGFRSATTTTRNVDQEIGDNSANDLGTTPGETNQYCGWIEFSQTLTWLVDYKLQTTSGSFSLTGNNAKLFINRLTKTTAGVFSWTGNNAILTIGAGLTNYILETYKGVFTYAPWSSYDAFERVTLGGNWSTIGTPIIDSHHVNASTSGSTAILYTGRTFGKGGDYSGLLGEIPGSDTGTGMYLDWNFISGTSYCYRLMIDQLTDVSCRARVYKYNGGWVQIATAGTVSYSSRTTLRFRVHHNPVTGYLEAMIDRGSGWEVIATATDTEVLASNSQVVYRWYDSDATPGMYWDDTYMGDFEGSTLAKGSKILVTTGTFTLTGNNSIGLYQRITKTTTGIYTWTGNDAILTVGGGLVNYLLQTLLGTFTWSGNNAKLLEVRKLFTTNGVYTWSGNNVILSHLYNIFTTPGTFTWSGNNVILLRNYKTYVTTGVYTWVGNNAILTVGGGLTHYLLQTLLGTYTWAGNNSIGLYKHITYTNPGTYTWSGSNANLLENRNTKTATGTYTWSGNQGKLLFGRGITVSPGTFTLDGKNQILLWLHKMLTTPGVYTLTGLPAILLILSVLVPATEGRIYYVPFEDRVLVVEEENRLYNVDAETRLFTVEEENRFYKILFENRTVKVNPNETK